MPPLVVHFPVLGGYDQVFVLGLRREKEVAAVITSNVTGLVDEVYVPFSRRSVAGALDAKRRTPSTCRLCLVALNLSEIYAMHQANSMRQS